MKSKIIEIFGKLLYTAIGKNILANFAKVLVIFIRQILLVPLYITYWGTEMYGDWIILSAITAFFNMSDMGLNSVTNNLFCIRYAEKKYDECQSLIKNNYILLWTLASLVLLILAVISYLFDITKILGLSTVSRNDGSVIVLLLVFKIFLDMSSFIPDSIYNANSLASKATNINTILRLSVALVILLGIIAGFTMLEVVIISTFPTLFSIAYKHFNVKNLFMPKEPAKFDKKLLKALLKPSITYMAFPASLAILYQGFTIIVNRFYGAETLILFNTTRTMVNFVRNMVEVVTSGVKSEFSVAFGRKDISRMKMIHKKSIQASMLISLASCLVLVIGGPWIYEVWTRGKIQFNSTLMISFFAVIMLNTIWTANSMVLMATNRHSKLGIVYLNASILSICLAYLLSNFQIIQVTAICIAVSDFIACIYSYKLAISFLKQEIS